MDKVVLLADPNSKAWDFACKICDYVQKTKDVFIPLRKLSVNQFRNNEIDMHVLENIRKKEVYFIHDSSKNPQEWWVELLLLKDLLLNASAESVTFVLPNMLYSRKDRKEKSRVPISARALAWSISPGLKRIITMDLHASQIQGFYPENVPLDNLYSFPAVAKYIKENNIISSFENLVVLSPDAGGVDRAKSFAQRLGCNSLAFIYKRRTTEGIGDSRQIEETILVGDVKDKDVLIVDDIIDSGGTLCKAADLLKKSGAKKLFCYGTHGLFTNGTEELKKNFDKVMTSNTNHREGDDVTVIDVSHLFAEAIYRAQTGESISELFR
ncbi:MAG: ribose-phosphate pyrophosphokinase [Nanoarchaeota archaeon]|nr:ribose-phosphate pyrophosphokinase [Nanoarchaeota archaeon]